MRRNFNFLLAPFHKQAKLSASGRRSSETRRFIYFHSLLFLLSVVQISFALELFMQAEKRMNFFPSLSVWKFNKINFKLSLILIFFCLSNQQPNRWMFFNSLQWILCIHCCLLGRKKLHKFRSTNFPLCKLFSIGGECVCCICSSCRMSKRERVESRSFSIPQTANFRMRFSCGKMKEN